MIPLSLFFFSKIVFGYFSSLAFPYTFEKKLVFTGKKPCWDELLFLNVSMTFFILCLFYCPALQFSHHHRAKVSFRDRLSRFQNFSVEKSFFFLFRAVPATYGSSQAELNWSCSCQPIPQPQQCGIRASSTTYTAAHSEDGSPTH